MNWPPSRGPMPERMKQKFEYPILECQDFEFQPQKIDREERKLVDVLLRDKGIVKPASKPGQKPPTVKFPKVSPKQWRYPMKIRCGVDVEALASVTVEQARRLVVGILDHGDKPRRNAFTGVSRYWEFESYLEARPLTIQINYPLAKGVRLTIKPYNRVWFGENGEARRLILEMSLGYVLWTVAKQYERIYREWERYGVWGHACSDLVFEGLVVNQDATAHLIIGS